MKELLRRIWRNWQELGRDLGDFQAHALLTVFYFTVLIPFGVLVRLLADPLSVRPSGASSSWSRRESPITSLDSARRQF